MFLFPKKYNKRILLEDALKHIFHLVQKNNEASLESMAGALKIKVKLAQTLIEDMQNKKLLVISGKGLVLTSTGKGLAVQIIRAHRLWESYLSERIGVPLEDLHGRAEAMEHKLSVEEINKLDESLGFPQRDPHGDPIPRDDHQDIEEESKPICLLDWPKNKFATIVHIEDEPQSIFNQITSEGFFRDTCLKVLDSTQKGLHVWTPLQELWIAPIVAANIFVSVAPKWFFQSNAQPLTFLQKGEKGKILSLTTQGLNRQRFMDLGLLPGTMIEAKFESPFKDPMAYEVRGAITVLRKNQAEQILIEPIK